MDASTKTSCLFSLVIMLCIGTTVAHGQAEVDSLKKYFDWADPCQRNVACPEGTPWYNEIRAVARVVSWPPADSVGHGCTGTFINNVNEDLTPYFLTAAHCAGGEIGQYSSVIYQFQWQTPGCTNPPTAPEFEYIFTPTQLMVEGVDAHGDPRGKSQDFALQLLPVNPDTLAARQVHFAGWSIEDLLPTSAVLIGHPQGDVKKIVSGVSTSPVAFDDSTWAINIDTGKLENGQSGSALLNENHEIVGVTRAGVACSGTGGQSNPKLEHFWSIPYWRPNPPKAFVSAMSFLDPDSTNATSLRSIANYTLEVEDHAFSNPSTDFAAGFFRTAKSIVAADDTLQAGGRLQFLARDTITVSGNFLAAVGGDLLIEIEESHAGSSSKARDGDTLFEFPESVSALAQNYPNPFRHSTTFRFTVPQRENVTMIIYDLLGRRIVTLMDGVHEPGDVTLHWVAADENTQPLASGVYIYQLRIGDTVESGQLTFLD